MLRIFRRGFRLIRHGLPLGPSRRNPFIPLNVVFMAKPVSELALPGKEIMAESPPFRTARPFTWMFKKSSTLSVRTRSVLCFVSCPTRFFGHIPHARRRAPALLRYGVTVARNAFLYSDPTQFGLEHAIAKAAKGTTQGALPVKLERPTAHVACLDCDKR